MKNQLKTTLITLLSSLHLTNYTVNAQSMSQQQDPPYDLRISGRILNAENQMIRDLSPNTPYLLEIMAENPFGTNSTTKGISIACIVPNSITVEEAIQPGYNSQDFFKDLKMNPTLNFTWTDGQLISLIREFDASENKSAQKKGVIGRFKIKATDSQTTYPARFNWGEPISSDGTRLQSVKNRDLLTAIIPASNTNDVNVFYDSHNGATPPINGKISCPYVSAPYFQKSNLVLEASANLLNWTSLSTNTTGSFEFLDLNSTNHNFRFYRAISQ